MSGFEARIREEKVSRPPATLKDLILRYQASPEARRASASMWRQRHRVFKRAAERFKGTTIADIDERGFRSRLYDWRDTFADRPSEGTNSVRIMCTVFSFGVDRGWLRDNPARGMIPLRRRASRADDVWGPEELEALLAAAPPHLRDVITVGLYTGLRECDVIRITAEQCDQGWLTIQPQKTRRSSGITLHLPYHLIKPLAAVFVRLLAVRWRSGEPMLRRQDGLRWTERELRRQFTAAKVAAGLGDSPLRFHDLRGTLTTWLLEAGCTDAEEGSITGGALAKGSKRSYAARTRELAVNAFTKLATKLASPAAAAGAASLMAAEEDE